MDKLYLSPNIQVEPLVDQWYLWSHLIPPATAARNLTERHMRIMESYVSAPRVHANAVKNPKLIGGPFMDYGINRATEVSELLSRTIRQNAPLISLSAALQDLDQMLREEACGESLHLLYPKIPQALKGYVELVYDRNNNASYRLIEPLIYKSDFYNTNSQSMMLSSLKGDDRPFVLSTPRLPDSNLFELKLPFESKALDALFDSKLNAADFCDLCDQCQVPQESVALFRTFFTNEKLKKYSAYNGTGCRWRYFGHACILIESKDVSILFDPVLSYTYEARVPRYTYSDLPDVIDYVVITHNHQDHVLFETLLQIRCRVRHIMVPRNGGAGLEDPSLRLSLEAIGFENIIELDEFQSVHFAGGTITGLPFLGEHADLNIRTKLAYMLEVRGTKLLFAADSCNIEPELYSHIRNCTGDIRAVFIGMECDGAPLSWLYGPLLSRRMERSQDESRRLCGSNFVQAMNIIEALNCKEAFVYAMGQEPWLRYIMSLEYTPESNPIVQSDRLLEACKERGIVAERLFGEREMIL